ncbi:MAG: malate dehydrogenase (quinone) [Polyangiaceae bacterium]
MTNATASTATDVVLIGAGIMSATLAALLRELDPSLSIEIFERLDGAAAESSDAWNNAGTGHSGFCELNYTPEKPDGTVDVSKAIQIAEQFELTKQFWTALVASGRLSSPWRFVRNVPHLSFVRGEKDIAYLKTRHANLVSSPLFERMEYTEDPKRIAEWVPLVMDGAPADVPVAATRMAAGTDVNFGSLARSLLRSVVSTEGAAVHLGHEVGDIRRDGDAWAIDVKDLKSGAVRAVRARFLFIGAGGYSLPLLERTGIPEAEGYGAFPVSGQWLRCTNYAVIARHEAKVYGKAEIGAPPMSVPHLDTRWIGTAAVRAPGHEEFGPMSTLPEKQLLFGPYAGITTRFLKKGSWLDLLRSVGIDNVRPVLDAGLANFDLTKYLIGQALLEPEERLAVLRTYCPSAELEDWELQIAGLRVQIIKSDGKGGGVLKFGTEVVTSADGTVAALLGASPGASTAVSVMLEVIERCFPERWKSDAWQATLHGLLPSFGKPLHHDRELCRSLRAVWSQS